MRDLLKKECAEIGIKLTDTQCGQFERYYELLINWNKKINQKKKQKRKEDLD